MADANKEPEEKLYSSILIAILLSADAWSSLVTFVMNGHLFDDKSKTPIYASVRKDLLDPESYISDAGLDMLLL